MELSFSLLGNPASDNSAVVRHSHFNDPITGCEKRLCGNSRRWADANTAVKLASIVSLIHESGRAGFNLEETAFVLAVARTESGFNPDAAAKSSSATGLGQFIDRTGEAYGLTDANRYNVGDNARALVAHLKDSLIRASKKTEGFDIYRLAYAFHHDGPSLSHGGEKIARERVLPTISRFQSLLAKLLQRP